ncbi:unnamed protein product [Trichogramma brassicae]|uniref:Uncharacterized protein n=1 Tax=Trichogramma brassicae TaxID=86971 RepID=A0A6H5ITI8_9HYME|nr:unnamed protein product [Trichogramma brassicae]
MQILTVILTELAAALAQLRRRRCTAGEQNLSIPITCALPNLYQTTPTAAATASHSHSSTRLGSKKKIKRLTVGIIPRRFCGISKRRHRRQQASTFRLVSKLRSKNNETRGITFLSTNIRCEHMHDRGGGGLAPYRVPYTIIVAVYVEIMAEEAIGEPSNVCPSYFHRFGSRYRSYVRRHTFDYEQRLSGEIKGTCLARATVSHVKLPEKNSRQESDADVYSAPRIHFLYIKFRQAGTRVRFFFFPQGGGSSEEGSRVWHFEASPRTLSDIDAGRDSRPVEKNSRRRQGTEEALETVDLDDATEPLYQSRRRVVKKARLFELLIWSPFKLLKNRCAPIVMRLQKFLSSYIMVLEKQGRYSIGFINIDVRTRT